MESNILLLHFKSSLKKYSSACILVLVSLSLEDFNYESTEFYSNVTTAKLKPNVIFFPPYHLRMELRAQLNTQDKYTVLLYKLILLISDGILWNRKKGK